MAGYVAIKVRVAPVGSLNIYLWLLVSSRAIYASGDYMRILVQAESMIKAFKEGSPIEIDGKPVFYKNLSTIRKNRFDIQRFEDSARQYQQIDRDNK
jgi:hypothetical protein